MDTFFQLKLTRYDTIYHKKATLQLNAFVDLTRNEPNVRSAHTWHYLLRCIFVEKYVYFFPIENILTY